MGRFMKKIVGAHKNIMGSSSSCSHDSSSTHFTEPKESLMHEGEEATPMEEPEQEQLMEVVDDAPYLDLEGDREMKAYNLIKNHEFVHTPLYDPTLL